MPKALSDIQAEGHNSNRSAFLPSGGGGGGAAPVEVTLDFGAFPVGSRQFSFTSTASVGQNVVMVASGADGDEAEMDGLVCAARVTATDTIEAFITAIPGPVAGQRRFNLLIG
jgi:hypothetical protein